MKTLSVSVACYNGKNFIRKCLDSFVESGVMEDVEILVTDDGSKDESPVIVSDYAEEWPGSIKLIRQENQGPGSTVRSGAKYASGKYFRMVDCDDWVDPVSFAALVRRLKETDADLVISSYTEVDDKTGEKRPRILYPPEGVRFGETVPAEKALQDDLFMHAAVFKTSIFKRISDGIFNGFYTDAQYLLFPLPYVKTAEYFSKEVYQYRVSLDGQSVSYPSLQKNVRQHRAMLDSVLRLAEEYGKRSDRKEALARFLFRRAAYYCGTQMGIDLSFYPDKERKKEFYAFYDSLKRLHPTVFREFSRLKTAKVLRFRFLYGAVSRLHRRKIGMKQYEVK